MIEDTIVVLLMHPIVFYLTHFVREFPFEEKKKTSHGIEI